MVSVGTGNTGSEFIFIDWMGLKSHVGLSSVFGQLLDLIYHFTTFLATLTLDLESKECVNNVTLLPSMATGFGVKWWRHNDWENGEKQLPLARHTKRKLAINVKVRANRIADNLENSLIKSLCWLIYFSAYLNWNSTRQYLTTIFRNIWVWRAAFHLTTKYAICLVSYEYISSVIHP